jgi:hypothetical protein
VRKLQIAIGRGRLISLISSRKSAVESRFFDFYQKLGNQTGEQPAPFITWVARVRGP